MTRSMTPGILVGAPSRAPSSTRAPRSSRFVTESHALSVPLANPRAMALAAVIAVALVLIGRRLSD